MNYKILCLIGIVLLLSLNIISADNVYVGTGGNDSNNGLSINTSKQTIKNATLSAKDNDKIYISKGVYKENNITINKTLTLIGDKKHGTIIDAQNKNRIFNITGKGRITIKYITFKNGNAYTGGAIYSEGRLYVSNCKFINNKCKSGSAIFSYNSYTIVKNSVFYKNKGSAAILTGAEVTKIYRSTFKKNTRGVVADRVLIKTSIFSGNVNKGSGGAVRATIKAVIFSSKFSKNKAKYGGAIMARHIRIKSSKFVKNSANSGGAISIVNSKPIKRNMIYKCNFIANFAKGAGGAIYLETYKDSMNGGKYKAVTSVKKSKFKLNKAKRGANVAKYINPYI